MGMIHRSEETGHNRLVSTVRIEINGAIYEAEYAIDDGVVTVFGERGSEATQKGGLSEYQVAVILLRTLVRKAHIDPVSADGV